MNGTAAYLNTDLDLVSPDDLTVPAAAFELLGLFALHDARRDDRRWYASFETREQHGDPESSIAIMIAAVESLAEPHRSMWRACASRALNIGYDCGSAPWAFTQGLSAPLLGRMAAIGASLHVTLYPARERPEGPRP